MLPLVLHEDVFGGGWLVRDQEADKILEAPINAFLASTL